MALISYYLERGFTPEYILNADEHTKMLLSASAMYNIELRVEREKLQYKALGLISEDYALPNNHNSLSNFGWSSFFPNKVYSFAHSGSSSNGYDYVDFLEDRYKNNLPLRLLAYEMPKNIGSALNNAINKTVVKIIYDDFVLVEKFEYSTDVVGDIPYSVNFQEFNANIVRSSGKDTAKSIMATASVNMVTNAALKASGLL